MTPQCLKKSFYFSTVGKVFIFGRGRGIHNVRLAGKYTDFNSAGKASAFKDRITAFRFRESQQKLSFCQNESELKAADT